MKLELGNIKVDVNVNKWGFAVVGIVLLVGIIIGVLL